MDIKALFGFEGKPVLVTGAGSGMGKAAAMLLTELGAEVYATVRSKPLDFPVAQEIKTDLSDPDSLDKLIRTLPGKLEALFICHGISNNHLRTNGLLVNLTNFYSFKYLKTDWSPELRITALLHISPPTVGGSGAPPCPKAPN